MPLEDGLPAGSRPAEPHGGLPAFFYLDYDGISRPHVVQTHEPVAPPAAASRSLPWAAVTHFVSPLRNPGLFPFFFPLLGLAHLKDYLQLFFLYIATSLLAFLSFGEIPASL